MGHAAYTKNILAVYYSFLYCDGNHTFTDKVSDSRFLQE